MISRVRAEAEGASVAEVERSLNTCWDVLHQSDVRLRREMFGERDEALVHARVTDEHFERYVEGGAARYKGRRVTSYLPEEPPRDLTWQAHNVTASSSSSANLGYFSSTAVPSSTFTFVPQQMNAKLEPPHKPCREGQHVFVPWEDAEEVATCARCQLVRDLTSEYPQIKPDDPVWGVNIMFVKKREEGEEHGFEKALRQLAYDGWVHGGYGVAPNVANAQGFIKTPQLLAHDLVAAVTNRLANDAEARWEEALKSPKLDGTIHVVRDSDGWQCALDTVGKTPRSRKHHVVDSAATFGEMVAKVEAILMPKSRRKG